MMVLVFNCGSSSIKYRLFDMPSEEQVASGLIERIGKNDSEASQLSKRGEISYHMPVKNYTAGFEIITAMITHAEKGVLQGLAEVNACGHRVVHGGEAYTGSVLIDDELEAGVEACFDLAPLHNPPNLSGIQTSRKIFGDIPQVACFDTAFHQSLPPKAYRYALPHELYEKYRIRRYGFHGISHRFVARRYAELTDHDRYGVNVITCHLGNGSSITAIENGLSVDTSMGLTPLEGLVMGTRSGDLDPEILLYLQRKGYKREEISLILNKKSGLLGLSGSSNDVRDLEERAGSGDTAAGMALDIFAYRVRKYIGGYMAVLNHVDAVIFTGGIGEGGAVMRARILGNLDGLGIILDKQLNRDCEGREGSVHTQDSIVGIYVIPTNEELAIARDTYQLTNEV